MAELQLFNIQGTVNELPSQQVALEAELQDLLEKNMSTFFGVTFLESEYKIPNGRMDSIGIDENKCPVIFEYKRSVNENVINQGLFYLDWLLDHKADFKLLVMAKDPDKADEIDWSMPCVICIANDFTKYDIHAVNLIPRNIKLVRYRKFGNDLIAFEHLNAPVVKPIVDDPDIQISKKNPGKDKNFTQYFSEAGEKNQQIYYKIKDYITSLGEDITENQLKLYVAFKKIKNIICVEVYQNWIFMHLKLNPDTVELKPGFIEDVRTKGHWGTGDLRIIIKTMEDFENAKALINRAYNEN